MTKKKILQYLRKEQLILGKIVVTKKYIKYYSLLYYGHPTEITTLFLLLMEIA